MAIVYYLTGQPAEIKRFSYATLTLILIAIIFQDYGIFVGTLLDVQVCELDGFNYYEKRWDGAVK